MLNHRHDQHGVWFDYDGNRYKDVYDIRLKTGEVLTFMYPNANSWNPEIGSNATRVVSDDEVDQVRLKTDEEIEAAKGWRMTGESRLKRLVNMFGNAIPAEPQPISTRQ